MSDSPNEHGNSSPGDSGRNPPDGRDLSEIVGRARLGDRQALQEIFDRFSERVFRYALVGLRNYSDAEDATSEVFLGVVKNIRRFQWRGNGSFESWLFRIAHNVVMSERRRRARRPLEYRGRLEDYLGEPELGAEEEATSNGALGELWDKVSRMPETQREVLALRFIAGLSAEEVGAAIGKSAGAVRVLQHRALAALRRELRGSYV